jgi:hypothetical protein
MMVRSLSKEIAEGLARAGYRDCRLLSPLQGWARTCNWVQEGSMDKLSLQNPVFATYVIAATIMIRLPQQEIAPSSCRAIQLCKIDFEGERR